MNIFVLDYDPKKAAKYHLVPHLIKMPLESAQMLCTAYHLFPSVPVEKLPVQIYRKSFAHHPCTKWVCESLDNWLWLRTLAYEIDAMRLYRFGNDKPHKSLSIIEALPLPNLPNKGLTKFAQAMPDYCKHEDPVVAYRTYYMKEKYHLLPENWILEYELVHPYERPFWWTETPSLALSK